MQYETVPSSGGTKRWRYYWTVKTDGTISPNRQVYGTVIFYGIK
jgi:hypothetical protein